MKDILSILFIILIIWLILFIILELSIVNIRKRTTINLFNELDKIFINRLNVIYKMIDNIKEYNKIDFENLSSNLYDYIKEYSEYDLNKKIWINEQLSSDIKKILLASTAYPELLNNPKYAKYEKQLKRYNKVIKKFSLRYNKALISYLDRFKIFPSSLICKLGKYEEYKYIDLN